ncbi:hypothetical protein RSOLAG22IIIB_09716 [Rhizoctonia solani]|uniref:Uncharacterized protein n=1 Tax=Rhizoctonia solani TaxID=456999 RepID=A0A0K6FZB8_9AGAM|nr:hypothetical protein RSOLAG22IIIB_09716 [Rhizoctonia solani]
MHLLAHLFDDIEAKGVTANYTTKPGEQMHSQLRGAFQASTKKRDTADAEVLRKAHAMAVYDYMQSEIDAFLQEDSQDAGLEEEHIESEAPIVRIQLSSKSNLLTFGLIEEIHSGNAAFHQFGSRVQKFISEVNSEFAVATPTRVYEYGLVKVQYESYEDWSGGIAS